MKLKSLFENLIRLLCRKIFRTLTSPNLDDQVARDDGAALEPVQVLQAGDRGPLTLQRTIFTFLEIKM